MEKKTITKIANPPIALYVALWSQELAVCRLAALYKSLNRDVTLHAAAPILR